MTALSLHVSHRRARRRNSKILGLALLTFSLGAFTNRVISVPSDLAGMWLALAGLVIASMLLGACAVALLGDLFARQRMRQLESAARAAEVRRRLLEHEEQFVWRGIRHDLATVRRN
jgi:hypothetical protein